MKVVIYRDTIARVETWGKLNELTNNLNCWGKVEGSVGTWECQFPSRVKRIVWVSLIPPHESCIPQSLLPLSTHLAVLTGLTCHPHVASFSPSEAD